VESVATHTECLAASVGTLQVRPADAAVIRAAQEYAAELDAGGDVTKLGPLYIAALTALGLTPAARAALAGKGVPTDGQRANPLDELRQRRRARGDGPEAVDSAAP
jgi:hypothetical protein